MAIITQKIVDAAKDTLNKSISTRDNARELHNRAIADTVDALERKNKIFADEKSKDKDKEEAIASLDKAKGMEVILAKSVATAETGLLELEQEHWKTYSQFQNEEEERREIAGITTDAYDILNHRYTMVGRSLDTDKDAIESHTQNLSDYAANLEEFNSVIGFETDKLKQAKEALAKEEAQDEPDEKAIGKHKTEIEESTAMLDEANASKSESEESIINETAIRDSLSALIQPQLDAKTLTGLFQTNINELIGNRADGENAYVNAAKAEAKDKGWLISASEARIMTRAYHYSMKDIKEKIVAAAEKGETKIVVEQLSAPLTEVLIEQGFDLSYEVVEERTIGKNVIGGKVASFVTDNWVKISWKFAVISDMA